MKKYSEKFLNDSDLLKFARVGFEFEFYMKELSFYKTLELLNQYLAPVKVWGFRKYHSDFTTDSKNFKIEPDLSGGANMVEMVTGPLEYFEAKFYLNLYKHTGIQMTNVQYILIYLSIMSLIRI
jgi:hypothetical protein